MKDDTTRLYIFADKSQYIFFSDICGLKYCSLSVDTIKSNYNLKTSAVEMIMDIIKNYLRPNNVRKGSVTFGVSPTYVFTPKFLKPVYLQVKKDILLVVKDPDSYNHLEDKK